MREVGMRKVVGAGRWQITAQFLGESLLLSFFSILLAVCLVALVLPWLNSTMAMQLSLNLDILPLLLILCLTVGVLAGSYPAFFLSSFPPAAVLRARQTGQTGHGTVRKGLVIVQFAASVSLIICTLIVVQQTEFLKTKDPGYSQDTLVINRRLISNNAQALKTRLQQVQGVRGATITYVSIAERTSYGTDVIGMRADTTDTRIMIPYLLTDADFLDVYQIPLVEGRGFFSTEVLASQDPPMEAANHIILNETAANQLGVRAGDLVTYWGKAREVVGVVKDFHFLPVRQAIGPYALVPGIFEVQSFLTVGIDSPDIRAALKRIDDVWKEFEPNRPAEFDFMDRDRAAQYAGESRLSRLFAMSSGLAIAIAALGLLGLIAFAAEIRGSEVAVRKVLGASEMSVVGLLAKEFVVLVGLSSVLAYPVSYVVMSQWLQNFAYRIPISPVYFVAGTAASLMITMATIAWQTVKAARANPVDALAYH
jgi:putative ABC transport system permease protein